jgi:ankyrin repeat protein
MEEAIHKNDIEMIEYLLEQGYDPNSKTEDGEPLLFLSTNLDIIKLLLDNGADPKATDEYGFMLENYSDNIEILSLLSKPRNIIITPKTKALRYKETLKLKNKRTKTFRVKKTIV